jgi:peptide/nickel transport system permease protein
MIKVAVHRLVAMVPILLAVVFFTFLLVRIAPGDHLSELRVKGQISVETLATLQRQYGLDRPWYVQFAKWCGQAAKGDLGYSVTYHTPVTSLLAEPLFNTFLLTSVGLLLALLVAVPLGVIAAGSRRPWLDSGFDFITSMTLALPAFLWALLAILLSVRTGWFPVGEVRSLDYDSLSCPARLSDMVHHLILPAAVIALRQVPSYLRQLHAGLREILAEEYILAARAKGLSETSILLRHALRNALNPIITMFGQSIGALLSGAFVVEVIMSWPGIGRLAVASLAAGDSNVLVACLLCAGAMLAVGNLLADLLLAVADPRIRRPHRL